MLSRYVRSIAASILTILICSSILTTSVAAQDCLDYGSYMRVVSDLDTRIAAYDVELYGSYVIVAGVDTENSNRGGFEVYDYSTPEAPVLVSRVLDQSEYYDVELVGSCAYAVYSGAIVVFSLTTIEMPLVVFYLPLPSGGPAELTRAGESSLAVLEADGIHFLDVSTPNWPVLVSTFEAEYSYSHGASSGNLVFATHNHGFDIIDITSNDTPTLVSSIDLSRRAADVAVVGHYCYVIAGGLRIFDISTPESPLQVGFNEELAANRLLVEQGIAYLGTGAGSSLGVASVDDPANPFLLGTVPGPEIIYGLAVADGYSYAACGYQGIHVSDISPLASARPFYTFDTSGWTVDVDVVDEMAYIADYAGGLKIMDFSVPTNPELKSTYLAPYYSVHSVVVRGDLAYLAAGDFVIVDVSSPESPSYVESLDFDLNAEGIAVAGDYAYLIGNGRLTVVDVSTPVNPAIVSTLDTWGSEVKIVDNILYVSSGGSGLFCIDVSDAGNPTVIGNANLYGTFCGFDVVDDRAYVAINEIGLAVFDVSNPFLPRHLVTIESPNFPFDVDVFTGFAYLADGGGGVQVYDLADPASPSWIGTLTDVDAYSVTVRPDRIYVGQFFEGLAVAYTQCNLPVMNGDPGDEEELPEPERIAGLSAYPNPFNPRTTISFSLERDEYVDIAVYDLVGRCVAVLSQQVYSAGSHSLTWTGRDNGGVEVASGTYFVRMSTDSKVDGTRVTLVR